MKQELQNLQMKQLKSVNLNCLQLFVVKHCLNLLKLKKQNSKLELVSLKQLLLMNLKPQEQPLKLQLNLLQVVFGLQMKQELQS